MIYYESLIGVPFIYLIWAYTSAAVLLFTWIETQGYVTITADTARQRTVTTNATYMS